MQYTEQELSTLIKNLETEFSAHIAEVTGAAQPTSLAKAEDDKPAKDESKDAPKAESKEPKAEESKEEKPKDAPAAEAKDGAKPEGEEAAPAAPSEEQPTGEAPVAPSADEGASGYDAEDIAHMDQMYMSMSKAELLAHHDSCVRALDAIGAEHTHAAPPAQAPAAPAAEQAAPAGEIDKCGDMSMSKSESNAELELAKSEAAASKAKAEELQKNLNGIQEFLTQLVKKVPQGKAITSMEQVAKNEDVSGEEKQLSKSEITQKLMQKAADPSLSKTDRDAINAFYLNQANLNTISHLLK